MDGRLALIITGTVLTAVLLGSQFGILLERHYLASPCPSCDCSCKEEEAAIYREMKNLVISRDELWDCKQDLARLQNEKNADIICMQEYCIGPWRP